MINHQFFIGKNNIKIAWFASLIKQNSPAVIFLQGKSDSYVKYLELADFFNKKGYSFYTFDYRGMGFSERLTEDKKKVHVEHFPDYADDAKLFYDNIVTSGNHSKIYLLAHSMGSGVAALYLEKYEHDFNAALLMSPMFMLNTDFPENFSLFVSGTLSFAGFGSSYVWGQKNREFKNFEESNKTSSKENFDKWIEITKKNPEIVTGGMTNRWLFEAIKWTKIIRKNSFKIKIPILILESGLDKHVKSEGIDEFLKNNQNSSKIIFPDAKHEIFLEKDLIKEKALDLIIHFFDSN